MVPELLAGKWRYRVCCIAHETAGGVGVESQHEGDEEVMCVPKGLKCLLSNAMVRGSIDQHHAKEHDMSRDTACSGKVDSDSQIVADAFFLDIVKAGTISKVKHDPVRWLHVLDIMSRNVNSSKNQQSVCDLAMEPCSLIKW